MRSFVGGLIVWVVLLGVWFFYIFQFSLSELLVGSLASALTLFALHRSLCAAPIGATIRFSWLAAICYVPTATVEGIRVLLSVLVRLLQGKPSGSVWQSISFHPAGNADEQHGRGAVATLLSTLTPNSYVVDVDAEGGRLVVHNLTDEPVSGLIRRIEGR